MTDPKDKTKVLVKAGEQLNGFAAACATTAPPPAAAGSSPARWSEKGNLMARRDNSDPCGIGKTLNWAFAWPANRRILYNRASCDPTGKP